ncbi:MAG: hypothetical protein LUE27_06775 [Clostridia bacterium]|nr:hypothetical protein [Clostridia bacterium]
MDIEETERYLAESKAPRSYERVNGINYMFLEEDDGWITIVECTEYGTAY